jgi:FtsH-binding integral membrane protein
VWQGWAVLFAYTAALLGPVFLLPKQPAVWVVFMVVGTVLLLWVCSKKGEPPGWNWGSR